MHAGVHSGDCSPILTAREDITVNRSHLRGRICHVKLLACSEIHALLSDVDRQREGFADIYSDIGL